MGTITFDYTNPEQDGIDAPTKGALDAHLYEREIVSGRFRTVQRFTIPLVEGVATAVLSDTGVNQCWVIRELAPIAGRKRFYKAVAGDAAFTDLVDVNPETFEPITATPTVADTIAAAVAAESAARAAGDAQPLRARMRPMSTEIYPAALTTVRQITPGGLAISYTAQSATRWDSPKFRYLSGTMTQFDPGNVVLGGVTRNTGADNVGVTIDSFILQGDRFSRMINTYGITDVQVYVDGMRLWDTPAQTGIGYQFVEAQFALEGSREIVIVFGNGVTLQTVHEASATIAPGPERDTLGLFGDSYADAGQGTYNAGLAGDLFAATGWGIVPLGQGSTGWAVNKDDELDPPNPLNKSPYESAERRAAIAAQNLTYLFALGSINSGLTPPTTVVTALETWYAGVQEDTPGLPVFLAGVEPYNLAVSDAGQEANNTAMRDKAAELGIPFIDWYEEEWMMGLSTLNVPGGTGTQAKLIGADGVHPGAEGNRFFAKRFADAIGQIRATA
jgi:hypothetical protein